MQAVILAGGKGTRLRPYTTVFPKPLMPIGEYPILEVVIRQLRKHGFRKLTLAVGHMHELFRAFFSEGEKWDLKIEYSLEDKPLGTAGPLKRIEGLEDDFLMMNGDILTDLNFGELMAFHKAHGGPATIVTHRREVKIDYGALDFDTDGVLRRYTEKPTLSYDVSMGIYCLSRRAVDVIPDDSYFDFPSLMNALMAEGEKIICRPYSGYWLDIGRPDDYEQAIQDFEKMEKILL